MSADLRETMRTARAIRRFTADPVDDAVVRRCLEAATWAPSGGNQQPWRFGLLRSPEAREVVAEGARRSLEVIQKTYGMSRPEPEDDSRRARGARAVFELHDRAADVPVTVLFTLQPLPASPRLLQGASIYPAMQNFLLAARAEGLGAVVTGWQIPVEDQLRQLVGIPEDWALASLVLAGWPRGRHGPVRRKPVEDVTFVDRWDQRFD